jgi:IS30 family transposase
LNRQVHTEESLKYRQLSELERYQIDAGIAIGMSIADIARKIDRPRCTVFRELKRNAHISREGYSAIYSCQQYDQRREKCRPRFKIQGEMKRWIDSRLKDKWSPEQIVGRARLDQRPIVGVETIYRYIYRDRKQGGELWKNLRHIRKTRKKRFPTPRWPKSLPRAPIDDRPQEANDRERLGDFERDLIVGRERRSYVLTIVDRKSRLVRLAKIARNTAEEVHIATLKALKGLDLRSLTNDNGCEFIRYEKTANALNTPIYFTRPYASWERGTVENTNKLIRQYVPKNSTIQEISDEQIKMVEMVLNDRPRKTLGYRTPKEVHFK